MMMAVAGRTKRRIYPRRCRGPHKWGPRLHEEGLRYRGAGWEAIRSHLGRTCPRYEGNGLPSFLHAPSLSTTESDILSLLVVRFLTRSECHLCDQARPILTSVVDGMGATMEEIDIDIHPEYSGYGSRIPVVLGPENEVLAEGAIRDRRVLRSALRRLA